METLFSDRVIFSLLSTSAPVWICVPLSAELWGCSQRPAGCHLATGTGEARLGDTVRFLSCALLV